MVASVRYFRFYGLNTGRVLCEVCPRGLFIGLDVQVSPAKQAGGSSIVGNSVRLWNFYPTCESLFSFFFSGPICCK